MGILPKPAEEAQNCWGHDTQDTCVQSLQQGTPWGTPALQWAAPCVPYWRATAMEMGQCVPKTLLSPKSRLCVHNAPANCPHYPGLCPSPLAECPQHPQWTVLSTVSLAPPGECPSTLGECPQCSQLSVPSTVSPAPMAVCTTPALCPQQHRLSVPITVAYHQHPLLTIPSIPAECPQHPCLSPAPQHCVPSTPS